MSQRLLAETSTDADLLLMTLSAQQRDLSSKLDTLSKVMELVDELRSVRAELCRLKNLVTRSRSGDSAASNDLESEVLSWQ